MAQTVQLNADEIEELMKQDPASKGDGGYQSFLVKLQEKLDQNTGDIILNNDDLSRIPAYAFDYKQGGWQTRLMHIFGRTLGPNLGRDAP
jgi:hypothetical protein